MGTRDGVEPFRIHLLHHQTSAALLELDEAIIGLEPGIDGDTTRAAVEVGIEGDDLGATGFAAVDQAHAESGGGWPGLQVAGQPQARLGTLGLAEYQCGAGGRHVLTQTSLVPVAVYRDVKTLVQQPQCGRGAGLSRADDGRLAPMSCRHAATIGVRSYVRKAPAHGDCKVHNRVCKIGNS